MKRTVCKFNVVSKCPNCSHWRAPENCDVRMILSHDLKSKCNSAVVELHVSVLETARRLPSTKNRKSRSNGNSRSNSNSTSSNGLGKKKRTIPELTMSMYDIL